MVDGTYTVAGTSVHPVAGFSFRVANNGARARASVLRNNGHTDIQLFELPNPMTAGEAALWVQSEKGIDLKGATVYTRGRTASGGDGPSVPDRQLTAAVASTSRMTAYDYVSADVDNLTALIEQRKLRAAALTADIPRLEIELKRLIQTQLGLKPKEVVVPAAKAGEITKTAKEAFDNFLILQAAKENPLKRGQNASGYEATLSNIAMMPDFKSRFDARLKTLEEEIATAPTTAAGIKDMVEQIKTAIPYNYEKMDTVAIRQHALNVIAGSKAWKPSKKALDLVKATSPKAAKAPRKRTAKAKTPAVVPKAMDMAMDMATPGTVDTDNANNDMPNQEEKVA